MSDVGLDAPAVTDLEPAVTDSRPAAPVAEPAPAGLVSGVAIEALLRHGLVFVVRLFGDEGHEARRLDQHIVVASARLDQTDRPRPILGKPSRRRASRASPADDDDVVGRHEAGPFRWGVSEDGEARGAGAILVHVAESQVGLGIGLVEIGARLAIGTARDRQQQRDREPSRGR